MVRIMIKFLKNVKFKPFKYTNLQIAERMGWIEKNATLITAVATAALAVLAFITCFYANKAYNSQNEIIKLQSEANRKQFDYYRNTTRPFVYAKGPWINNPPEHPDSLFDLTIEIVNVGNLPAKEIQIATFFDKAKKFKRYIPYSPMDNAIVVTGLFPNQTAPACILVVRELRKR